MDRRWDRVKRLTVQALGETDTPFGLEPSVVSVHASLGSGNRVKAFQQWLDEALRQVVYGYTGTWTEPYIDQAFSQARQRAAQLTGASPGGAVVSHIVADRSNRESAILQLTASELDGICNAASQQATRVMTHGLLANTKPQRLARAVAERLSKVGKDRSRMLVNAMVVKAFSSATLDAFRQAGIGQVGTIAERKPVKVAKGPHGLHVVDRGPYKTKVQRRVDLSSVDVLTAGDADVCELCEDISDNGPYDLDEAESLIPAHPNCRCAFVPADDLRFASVREDE